MRRTNFALPFFLVVPIALLATQQTGQSGPDVAGAARSAAALPQLHTLLVSAGGQVVFEYHARGRSIDRPANIKSAGKSVISALVGVAIDRGLISGVKQPIAAFFPELKRAADARKQRITVEDLLTMRSGLESTSGHNYGRWVSSRNWVSHVLTRPLVSDPGASMEYSTGTSHLLSAILTKVTKTSTWQFAQSTLGQALGTPLPRWTRDPQGIYLGGNEMLMTPRQMVAFGEVYLHEGRAGGRQIVSPEWVRTSCVPRTISRFDPDREYGYGWWIDEVGGHTACFAWGFGGQYIMVFRDLDLVVAATSSTATSDERHGYRRQLLDLIGNQVIPVVAERQLKSNRAPVRSVVPGALSRSPVELQ